MRNFFKWDANFETGIREIDSQHKHLVDLINVLYNGYNAKKTNKQLGSILEELINYTIYHFKTEEKYFELYNFEYKTEHVESHKSFTNRIVEFKSLFLQGKEITLQLMNFLREWLSSHILVADKKYVELVKKNLI